MKALLAPLLTRQTTPLTRAAFARLRAETTPDRTLFEVRAAINASGLDWEGDQLMIDLLFSNPEQAEELYEACYAPLLVVEAWDEVSHQGHTVTVVDA